MPKDINRDLYTEETILKLNLFSECFRAWYPVFLHNPYVKGLVIFDFFAGSGSDANGTPGSPLRLLCEAKGENKQNCLLAKNKGKDIQFIFNESMHRKSSSLAINVDKHFRLCKKKHSCNRCTYEEKTIVDNKEFKNIFNLEGIGDLLSDKKYGKFILLDQYGFAEVNENVFKQLICAPGTDFIFFISSSYIRRFKEHPAVKKYFDTRTINFDTSKPAECHREIAAYYKTLIPSNKEYYLHHFTMKKEPNYYGLIFGSNHSLGMEKFLQVCWKHDRYSGESNFNIDQDYEEDTLFYDPTKTNKMARVKKILENDILSGKISGNADGLKKALINGCLPKIFVEVISELTKNGRINIIGDFNRQATNIHKVKKYQIEVPS
ncbi:MAG: three-Cys-motif partner protein TcmP [Planctomycetes bacterium]|nr:three-Cys-motif partner protein TcmP [Planctomycetota bacterium]